MNKANRSTIFVLTVAVTALVFLGAGCKGAVDETVDDALSPVSTSLDVLGQAKTLSEDQRAKVNREAELATNEVTVAMILIEGRTAESGTELGDEIGCNDRIAYMKLSRETATDSVVCDALNTLFAAREIDGLHNSLEFSSLEVDKVQSRDGVTTEVWINGDIMSAGACDDPRIRGQIEWTIKRFRPKFKVFLNGSESEWRCFGDMSGLCK